MIKTDGHMIIHFGVRVNDIDKVMPLLKELQTQINNIEIPRGMWILVDDMTLDTLEEEDGGYNER